MSDHWIYVVLAYGVTIATIGAIAARIILEHRRLRAELARYGVRGARDDGEAA